MGFGDGKAGVSLELGHEYTTWDDEHECDSCTHGQFGYIPDPCTGCAWYKHNHTLGKPNLWEPKGGDE
jgi:hypothetical protein